MQQMGLQARLMSQALRKMSGNASKAGCTLIFLNQIRYKVFPFLYPKSLGGGDAIPFHSYSTSPGLSITSHLDVFLTFSNLGHRPGMMGTTTTAVF